MKTDGYDKKIARKNRRRFVFAKGVCYTGHMENSRYGAEKMQRKLPGAFLDRMKGQLGADYEAFLASYNRERTYGLRYNPLKAEREAFLRQMPFALRPVPWAAEGFYYEPAAQPGRHVLHEAGAYYIQEPSAMAVVPLLDPQPGERILDLCAAPGGKSTHIAGRMRGQGLLVANEVTASRAGVLSQNIERMGVANCVVCREEPERIAALFPAFFDRVLVDAPCSGEGMFRKDETAVAEWSEENVAMCAARQREILEEASRTVRPGGVLVYSTCTFSPSEDEEMAEDFVRAHPDYFIEGTPVRLMPHLAEGEGHFAVRFRREGQMDADGCRAAAACAGRRGTEGGLYARCGEGPGGKKKRDGVNGKRGGKSTDVSGEREKAACDFLYRELELTEDSAAAMFAGRVTQNFGNAVYLTPEEMPPLDGIRLERPGLQLGLCEKGRMKPSHALALALRPEDVGRSYQMTPEQAAAYVRGETFAVDPALKGWYLLSVQGYSLGFGKAAGGQMKNHYPKGLRRPLM